MIPYTEAAKAAHLEDPNFGLDSPSQYYDKEKQTISWYDRVLLNRPSKVVLAVFLTAVLSPILIYQFVVSTSIDVPPSDGYTFGSCLLPRASRLRCGHGNITQQLCHSQCCYDLSNNVCYHRLPSRFSYLMDRNWTEETDLHPRIATEPFNFQPSIKTIRMSVNEVSRTHLTLSFYNTDTLEARNGSRLNETDFSYEVSSPELNVQVDSTRGTIFKTMRGPLIAAEDIWEITFKLTNESMFGLGEIPLQEGMVKILYGHKGGHNTVPLIFAKSNGSYHGVLIEVPAPTEVSIQGDNQVVVRSITSTELKLHLLVGPEPKDVMRDVMAILRVESPLQYWMMGAHVCNSVTDDTPQESLEKLRQFISDAQSEGVPYESHCGLGPVVLEDHADGDRETVAQDGVTAIKGAGKRYVPHLSPYIKYNGTNETTSNGTLSEFDAILLRDADGNETYIGSAQGSPVVYPDYEIDTGRALLSTLWTLRGQTDGILLENNWPLDETPKKLNETQLYLPYFNRHFEAAFNLTPQWNATRPSGDRHLYSHNNYGDHFYSSVRNITGGNLPIWTSSPWMNGAAIINRQNIDVSWTNLRKELVESSLSGVSGQWFSASPICGDTEHFAEETQTTLCVNWYKVATYLPLIKIHSTEFPRHPLAFVGNNRAYIMDALNKRLSLLPYFYTTLQDGPLLRPMFYQFPQMESLANTTTQYAVGEDLLVVPDLLPGQSHVNIWMPPGSWYELWSGLRIVAEEGEAVAMSSTDADILTLIRGGAVVFLQKTVGLTAEETRRSANFQLVVALCQSSDLLTSVPQAEGRLFVTNNLVIHVTADSEKLTITQAGGDFGSICGGEAVSANLIDEINVYGLPEELNNYDHHREVGAAIDLCALETEREIVLNFVTQE